MRALLFLSDSSYRPPRETEVISSKPSGDRFVNVGNASILNGIGDVADQGVAIGSSTNPKVQNEDRGRFANAGAWTVNAIRAAPRRPGLGDRESDDPHQ